MFQIVDRGDRSKGFLTLFFDVVLILFFASSNGDTEPIAWDGDKMQLLISDGTSSATSIARNELLMPTSIEITAKSSKGVKKLNDLLKD